jgi:hypothetical protein
MHNAMASAFENAVPGRLVCRSYETRSRSLPLLRAGAALKKTKSPSLNGSGPVQNGNYSLIALLVTAMQQG